MTTATTEQLDGANVRRCTFPGCDRQHKGRGYCDVHLQQFRKGKELTPIKARKSRRRCEVSDCENDHDAGGLCARHRKAKQRAEQRAARPIPAPRPPKPCAVDYCPHEATTAGLCSRHYTNMRKHGTPEAPHPRPTKGKGGDPIEFIRNKITVTGTGCWEFNAWWTTEGGYGSFSYGGKNWQAHRWAWVHLAGLKLPEYSGAGMELDHICLNPACIRPCHLQLIPHAENMRLRTARRNLLENAAPDEYLAAPNKPRNLLEQFATIRLSPELLEHEGWGMPQNFEILYP